MRTQLLFVIFLILSAAQVKASESMLAGAGMAPCSQFNIDINQDNTYEYIYYGWARGYMSAINVRNNARSGRSINLTPSSFGGREQLKFLKNYCSANPAKMVVIGIMTLFEELGKI